MRRLTLCVATMAIAACGGSHPKDADLLDRFARHKSEMKQLIGMFQQDAGLSRVGATFTKPEKPAEIRVMPQRIEEYRRLCAAVGAPDCIEGADRSEAKDPIWIHVSSAGLLFSRSSKGYYYSTAPKGEIVVDLDSLSPTRSGTWLRRIEGPWYLYYTFED